MHSTRGTCAAAMGLALGWGAIVPASPGQGARFEVSLDAGHEPAAGRLVVYVLADGAMVQPGSQPGDGPFLEDPQPVFGIDTSLKGGEHATIDDRAVSFPVPPGKLPPGRYKAQAVLDMHYDNSSWRREPGNLFSDSVPFEIVAGQPRATVALSLARTVGPRDEPAMRGVEYVSVRSDLLSKFHGREIVMRAAVRRPAGFDPARKYAAVYEVPGFGGDHVSAAQHPLLIGSDADTLRANIFWITLDPESGNGHTLFADSSNNGPCGEALVKELIPAIQAKLPLIPEPAARLLRGHSSGGWSAIWLATTYAETFGSCWASSPDPVDFRRFQLVDIYERRNMYHLEPEEFPHKPLTDQMPDTPSMRLNGQITMTIRQENRAEEVLGPKNTSGQQWDSWQAVAGPRVGSGAAAHPAALYDPKTGEIDHAVAEQYRKYDLADLLRHDAARLGPIYKQRVRILVGDDDNFYLNEAVVLLKAEVDKLNFLVLPEGGFGKIVIVPGRDHGSIMQTPEARAIPTEILGHLRRHGYAAAAADRKP